MDGLLIDTEKLYREAIFDACSALGYEMTPERHLQMIGSPWDVNRAQLLGWFGDGFPVEVFHDDCRARFRVFCAGGADLRPGVLELVAFLEAEGVPTAVATSAGRESARAHLAHAGLLDGFRAVVTRDDVANGKPHPDVFLRAAEHLGVQPGWCLALEDSHNGVRAAASAGMMTVMVPDLLDPIPEIADRCVHVARDLHEVRRLVAGAMAKA